jgi:UDP-glucose 4-epimerase
MRSVLGFRPSYTTAEAFADFASTFAPGLLPRPAGPLHVEDDRTAVGAGGSRG